MSDLIYRCNDCDWIGPERMLLKAKSPFRFDLEISGCPACGAAEDFTNMCDEPGCKQEAGCGFPVAGGGYRRTCSEHYRKYSNENL